MKALQVPPPEIQYKKPQFQHNLYRECGFLDVSLLWKRRSQKCCSTTRGQFWRQEVFCRVLRIWLFPNQRPALKWLGIMMCNRRSAWRRLSRTRQQHRFASICAGNAPIYGGDDGVLAGSGPVDAGKADAVWRRGAGCAERVVERKGGRGGRGRGKQRGAEARGVKGEGG